jgi:hypothetical protein
MRRSSCPSSAPASRFRTARNNNRRPRRERRRRKPPNSHGDPQHLTITLRVRLEPESIVDRTELVLASHGELIGFIFAPLRKAYPCAEAERVLPAINAAPTKTYINARAVPFTSASCRDRHRDQPYRRFVSAVFERAPRTPASAVLRVRPETAVGQRMNTSVATMYLPSTQLPLTPTRCPTFNSVIPTRWEPR